MLQKCSSANSCIRMRTRIVMVEHYTRCQHSTPFALNVPTQFFCSTFMTLLCSIHTWIPRSAHFSCST
jgi:hypothetical protein